MPTTMPSEAHAHTHAQCEWVNLHVSHDLFRNAQPHDAAYQEKEDGCMLTPRTILTRSGLSTVLVVLSLRS